MIIEPYILFILGIVFLAGIASAFSALNKFEILAVLFVLSTIIASLLYDNQPEWSVDGRASGLGSYLRGGLIIICGAIGIIYYLLNSSKHKFNVPLHLIILFIFAVFSLGSVFYSIDTASTLIRASLFMSTFFLLLGMNTWLEDEARMETLLNALFVLACVFIIINFISLFVAPSRVWWWKAPSRFIGLSSHPNEIGGFFLMAFPVLLWKFYQNGIKGKYFSLLIIALNILLLILTGSRTSLAGAVISIFIWFLVYKDWMKFVSFAMILILAVLIGSQLDIRSYERDKDSRIYDLTEREQIWEGALLFAENRPLAGYGYSVESRIFDNQYLFDIEGKSVDINAQTPLHNGYLSIFIGGGLLGLLLWLMVLGLPVYYLLTSSLSNYKAFALATITPILITNFVESAVTGYFSSSDIYFWLAWIIAGKVYLINESSSAESKRSVQLVN